MFRASLRPSSGGQTAFSLPIFSVLLWLLWCWRVGWLAVCTVWSRLLATYSTQCTQHAIRLSDITTATRGQKTIGSENAVWPPDDGRKDARNMLRNNWLPIKSVFVASSWSRLYLLIKDARSFEYKVYYNIYDWDLQSKNKRSWYDNFPSGMTKKVELIL